MNIKLLIIFVFAAVISAAPAFAVVTIKVQEKTEVCKESVRLEDIAHISGGEQKLRRRLCALIICKAPLPAKKRSLDEKYIRLRLKQAGMDSGELNLIVPDKAVIARSYITITKAKTADIVSGYIRKELAGLGSEATLKNVIVSKDLILPAGSVEYRVINEKQADYSGRMVVYVDFTVDACFHKKIRALVDIERLGNVVVTSRPLGRHKIITRDDLAVQRVDISKLSVNVISDPDRVIGRRTKRSIDPSTILRTDLLELPPIVKRGDVVTIIAESGGLRVTARGKIKKRGHRGERLKVMNLDTKKVIYAHVIDSNTVKVTF